MCHNNIIIENEKNNQNNYTTNSKIKTIDYIDAIVSWIFVIPLGSLPVVGLIAFYLGFHIVYKKSKIGMPNVILAFGFICSCIASLLHLFIIFFISYNPLLPSGSESLPAFVTLLTVHVSLLFISIYKVVCGNNACN